MNALSSAGLGGHGALHISVSEFLAPSAGLNKRKRRPAGTPDPGAEVVALSPKTLMESDRYVCEICNQGFQREQNLQMHRRRHKVPWKLLKKPSSLVTNRRVYICPERSCLHHDPTHALGDLVGIKKHYRRKHCTDKQWKCVKCSKRYAVQSDYKAHLKTCGTRGHCCDCGRVFSRVESFIEHQDTCNAVKQKATRTQNSSRLHSTDIILPTESPSEYSSSDTVSFAQRSDSTAEIISMNETHPTESELNKEVHAMPSWLISTDRPSELELLQRLPIVEFSLQEVTGTGSIGSKTDLLQEEIHSAPCLRLSIGPAGSSSTAEIASSCPSSHPSLHVDCRKPRFSGTVGSETSTSLNQRQSGSIVRVLDKSKSHSAAAIGKDLALSIADHAGSSTSDFLAQATTGWSVESCLYRRLTERVTNFNPRSEFSTPSDHQDHLRRSELLARLRDTKDEVQSGVLRREAPTRSSSCKNHAKPCLRLFLPNG